MDLATVQTTSEALSFLNESFHSQLQGAESQNAVPNTAIPGDARANAAFRALLVLADQRTFFLLLIQNQRFWPRLRSLVGSPPYTFLRPEDSGVLNATGINHARKNLAKTTFMSSSSDFGFGHFRDAHGRLYRVVARKSVGQVPWRDVNAGERIVVDVRLKSARGGGVSKSGGARAGARADVGHVSPQQGDLVQLTLVPQLTSGHDDAPTVAARVEGGCQKPHSAVARLVLKVG